MSVVLQTNKNVSKNKKAEKRVTIFDRELSTFSKYVRALALKLINEARMVMKGVLPGAMYLPLGRKQ